jgi:hypothetical protein
MRLCGRVLVCLDNSWDKFRSKTARACVAQLAFRFDASFPACLAAVRVKRRPSAGCYDDVTGA